MPGGGLEVATDIRYVLRSARGPIVGFTVHRFSTVDLDAVHEEVFAGPRFHVPLLGLERATLGEVVLAARARFEVSTADVCFFMLALACAEEEARSAYRRAIRREREGSFRTDAPERLRALDQRKQSSS